MQNSPFQSCAHFLEIPLHTSLWEQMAGHPRPALQRQIKQAKQVSARGLLRTLLQVVSCQWHMLFRGGRRSNRVHCYLVRRFPFFNRNEMHSSCINWAKGHRGKQRGQEGKLTFGKWFFCQPKKSHLAKLWYDNLTTTDYCDIQSTKTKLRTNLF